MQSWGFEALQAPDATEATHIVEKQDPDIVITDVVMPVMSGKAMATALRGSHPDTKILYTSGYSEEVIGDHGVLRPGIEFLQKPYLAAQVVYADKEIEQFRQQKLEE